MTVLSGSQKWRLTIEVTTIDVGIELEQFVDHFHSAHSGYQDWRGVSQPDIYVDILMCNLPE